MSLTYIDIEGRSTATELPAVARTDKPNTGFNIIGSPTNCYMIYDCISDGVRVVVLWRGDI